MQIGPYTISLARLEYYRAQLEGIEIAAEANGRLNEFSEDQEVSFVKDIAVVFNNFCKEMFGETGVIEDLHLSEAYMEVTENGAPDAQRIYCLQYARHDRDPRTDPPSEQQLRQELRREAREAEQDLRRFLDLNSDLSPTS